MLSIYNFCLYVVDSNMEVIKYGHWITVFLTWNKGQAIYIYHYIQVQKGQNDNKGKFRKTFYSKTPDLTNNLSQGAQYLLAVHTLEVYKINLQHIFFLDKMHLTAQDDKQDE